MQQRFLGFDHIDTRVPDLRAVEGFYARLLPALGLSQAKRSYVEGDRWADESPEHPYNTVEYYQDDTPVPFFIGIIEDPQTQPVRTRIAFRVGSKDDLPRWRDFLQSIDARAIEFTPNDDYPAVFFEDPAGTKLELVARPPRS
jgi:catechol 2,3-dioxygenase-like lactoylglutathione lyase family enzyme